MKLKTVYATDMKHLEKSESSWLGYQKRFPVIARIFCATEPARATMESRDGGTVFRIAPHFRPAVAELGDSIDRIRRSFLDVQDERAALDFLGETGGLIYSSFELFESEQEITWEFFQECQAIVRHLYLFGFPYDPQSEKSSFKDNVPREIYEISERLPKEVFDLVGEISLARLSFDNEDGMRQPYLIFDLGSALAGIVASIYLDHQAGESFRLCRLQGCNNIFSMLGQRADKYFCCTDHARHHSIRKSRAEAKSKKDAAAKVEAKKTRNAKVKRNG